MSWLNLDASGFAAMIRWESVSVAGLVLGGWKVSSQGKSARTARWTMDLSDLAKFPSSIGPFE